MPRRDGLSKFLGTTRKQRKRRSRNAQSWKDRGRPSGRVTSKRQKEQG